MSRLQDMIMDSYRREVEYLRNRVAELEISRDPGTPEDVAASALHFADVIGTIRVDDVSQAVALQNIVINIRHACEVLRNG